MTIQCNECGSLLGEGAVVCSRCDLAAIVPVVAEPADLPSELPTTLIDSQVSQTAPLFSAVSNSADRGLTGIGGWLILHVIGLAVAPLLNLIALVIDCGFLLSSRDNAAFAAHPGLEGVLLFEVITNLLFFVALICFNFLFYRKKKSLPTYAIIYFASQFVFLLADHLMTASLIPSSFPTEVVRSFLICLIWMPYFLNSRRVQLTFVN